MIGSATFPLFGLHFIPHRSPIVIDGLIFIPLLVILKHHENIRRLVAGTESRFGKKKAAA
jgi:glycerol-3-phosphate acyltransferase PlsY